MLEVEHLAKSFGPIKALRDVSLSLAGGEVRAVCGENGAGKSTLMQLLMGDIAARRGIDQVGREMLSSSTVRRRRSGLELR